MSSLMLASVKSSAVDLPTSLCANREAQATEPVSAEEILKRESHTKPNAKATPTSKIISNEQAESVSESSGARPLSQEGKTKPDGKDSGQTNAEETKAHVVKKGPKKGRRSRRPSRSVKRYYNMFSSKEALDNAIRQWHDDAKFFETFKLLFTNGPIIKLINGLPEVTRRGVKARLAQVVDFQESTMAYDIEASDWDVDQRREKHEGSEHQGKTQLFVVLFRRVLDWFYGKEYLEKKMEEGRERRRILDRLREMGIPHEVSGEELDQLVQESQKKQRPFKGAVFDPFACKEWPDLDAEKVPDTIDTLLADNVVQQQ